MNLGEMETLLKRYGFDSGDPLLQWLNAGMHEVEADHDWNFLESSLETFNTTAGGPNVSVPFGTTKVISLRDLTNSRKLKYMGWWKYTREIENPKAEGHPEIYTVTQGSAFVTLWPVPNGVFEIETICQLLTKDLVVSGDVPKTATGHEWPLPMHFPIVLKAAIIALFSENEEERGEKLQKQFDTLIERLRRRYADYTLDEPDTVQDVQGYSQTIGVAPHYR